MPKKWITVTDLIALLSAMPGDAKVNTEGCDCIGRCSGASLGYHQNKSYDGEVVLLRDDNAGEEI